MMCNRQFLQARAQQQVSLFWRRLLQIAIEARSAYLGYLALLFHGQNYSFERERDFDTAIDSLPPSLVRFDAAPLTCSKARFKKSTSSCLRPSSLSNSAIRNSAASGRGGETVCDLLPGGRPLRRSNAALPPARNWSRHW